MKNSPIAPQPTPSALKFDFAGLDLQVRDSPFHRWLGVGLSKLTEDLIELTLPWREEFVSHPTRRYTHGGILASLIDLAADYAITVKLGRGVPTVDMRVDYHKAAMPGPLMARRSSIRRRMARSCESSMPSARTHGRSWIAAL